MARVLVGCDVGGTFTDAVALEQATGQLARAKAPTTPERLPDGVANAIEHALDRLNARPDAVERVLHGTTTATNALLERDLPRTALVTNEGFADVLEIGRQDRPALYDLDETRPDPIVPRELRFTIQARTAADGEVLQPVDPAAVDGLAQRLHAADVDAVAVCLLHAHRSGDQEALVADRLAKHVDAHVVASHQVSPEFREVERFTTTVVNAALTPRMRRYLDALTRRLEESGLTTPVRVLDSAGALATPSQAARLPVRTVLSGPAGGVAALTLLSKATGTRSLLGVDMGGTSTDASLVLDGEPSQRWETEVAGHRLQIPAADVDTVGAGGGSIAWIDDAGGLRVGPASAGADPGPACYDRGGTDATVTDANLHLNRIPPGTRLGGQLVLAPERARAALDRVADEAGTSIGETARSIVRIAVAHAVRGTRRLVARNAADPTQLTLTAFGGAGPQLATAWANALDIPRVLVPRHAGVTSAWGLLAAPPRVERSRSLLTPLDELTPRALDEAYQPLEAQAARVLHADEPRLERLAATRYQGQSHELTVTATDPASLRSTFEAAHRGHHGYALPGAPVEVVTIRARAVDQPALTAEPASPTDRSNAPEPTGTVDAWHAGPDAVEPTPVVEADELAPGHRIEGPCIVRARDTTTVVGPPWRARLTGEGHLLLERREVST